MLIEQIINEVIVSNNEREWFQLKLNEIKEGQKTRTFYLAFSSAHRFIQKIPIKFSEDHLKNLEEVYPGFNGSIWNSQQLVRLGFVLGLNTDENKSIIENLFSTADVEELVVLYRSLYFLKNAKEFTARGAEGVRTNMSNVFDALTLDNPFPSTYFNQEEWNQIVLKSIFMERPIYRIVGLEKRANESLANIASNFAHERWAAGRKVSPELWRLTNGFLNDAIFEDLKKVLSTDSQLAKEAASRVIIESNNQSAKSWLEEQKINSTPKTWREIGIQIEIE